MLNSLECSDSVNYPALLLEFCSLKVCTQSHSFCVIKSSKAHLQTFISLHPYLSLPFSQTRSFLASSPSDFAGSPPLFPDYSKV